MAKKSPFESDLEQQLAHQAPARPLEVLKLGDSKPRSSTTSSRASFEASIDALVNEQLTKLAEAAREPQVGDLEKEVLVRTASVPADHDVLPEAPLPAQTSGLDWSGSMEAGPTLIGRRRDDAAGGKDALPYSIKPKFHIAAQSTLSRVSEDIARSSALSESLSASLTGGDRCNSSNLGFDDSKSPVQSGHSSVTTPATAGSTYDSPFESAKFQDEPIARPPIVPEVAPEEVQQRSASGPSPLVESLLTQAAVEAGSGSPAKAVPIIQEVMDLLKGASEPVAQTQRSMNRSGTAAVARLEDAEQLTYRRQTGMKSLSVLETDGIPLLRSKVGQGVLQERSNSPILRPHLAQEGGIKPAGVNVRPTPAHSTPGLPTRSQTVPSQELRLALDELQQGAGGSGTFKRQAERPSTLRTIESGQPFPPVPPVWPCEGDEDMSAPTALQQDITAFQPVEDSVRSPPRSPSLFDLAAPQMSQDSAEWLIAWDDIELGRRIGAGSFGEVFRAQWRHTDVAVKIITNVNESLVGEFKAEVNLMSKLKHPNIVQFLGACIEYPHLAIITQFLPRGSLFNLLHRAKVQLDMRQKLWMALDVAKGMHYLHSCRPPIVHGDVSSKNMLVDRDFSIRVADFGMSRQRRKAMLSAKSQGGTAEWTAPEVLRGLPYHEKADVYSFGVVLHELMTQAVPWSDLSSIQVVGAVGWGNARLQIPTTLPQPIRALMASCMESDPQKRPDFEQIIVALRSIRQNTPAPPPAPKEGSRPGLGVRTVVSPTSSQEVEDSRARRSESLNSRHSM